MVNYFVESPVDLILDRSNIIVYVLNNNNLLYKLRKYRWFKRVVLPENVDSLLESPLAKNNVKNKSILRLSGAGVVFTCNYSESPNSAASFVLPRYIFLLAFLNNDDARHYLAKNVVVAVIKEEMRASFALSVIMSQVKRKKKQNPSKMCHVCAKQNIRKINTKSVNVTDPRFSIFTITGIFIKKTINIKFVIIFFISYSEEISNDELVGPPIKAMKNKSMWYRRERSLQNVDTLFCFLTNNLFLFQKFHLFKECDLECQFSVSSYAESYDVILSHSVHILA
ncbi:hypothetical protein WN51_04962 [Melipona quadrifasciata]|uniref:Uncharacterized protein n=1 Tax=Melipona quadrifasciata TaxID=166423 RepID=A0A0M8ZRK6_9HYME|nr:hypothetical protein WN51_04962 [Melipona quadrifasciata]